MLRKEFKEGLSVYDKIFFVKHLQYSPYEIINSWFQKYANPNQFTICTANTDVEGQGFYAAIIVENRNPKIEAIMSDFKETAAMLMSDK